MTNNVFELAFPFWDGLFEERSKDLNLNASRAADPEQFIPHLVIWFRAPKKTQFYVIAWVTMLYMLYRFLLITIEIYKQ